jgi:glycine cleavage system H protein|tara:strand:- start:1310 stop:1684 length:375 start_codon:yes stop_codon:yes gene_type:complete
MDPNNLKYTKDHEWISIDGDYAFVGITNFAQKELGDIVFVEIESLEQEIKSGEVFGSVEAVKTVSDLFMPMTGEIIEVNQKIIDNPELVNSDPYGEGWMIKIKIFDSNEVEDLLDLKSYEEISG